MPGQPLFAGPAAASRGRAAPPCTAPNSLAMPAFLGPHLMRTSRGAAPGTEVASGCRTLSDPTKLVVQASGRIETRGGATPQTKYEPPERSLLRDRLGPLLRANPGKPGDAEPRGYVLAVARAGGIGQSSRQRLPTGHWRLFSLRLKELVARHTLASYRESTSRKGQPSGNRGHAKPSAYVPPRGSRGAG